MGAGININGMEFEVREDCDYKTDWERVIKDLEGGFHDLSMYRYLVQNDLFFIVYFVMRIGIAHHPYVVKACKDVDKGARSYTEDLWFREGFKSTIITVAETIQDLAKDGEERICVLSYSRPAALSFVRSIKYLLETSELLKACFPDTFYGHPETEAFRWSEEAGLYVKRRGSAKEASVEGWGLIDGMPTRQHYTKIVYDDIVTDDMVKHPEQNEKLKEKFDMSMNLMSFGGRVRVVGTTYHHEDVLSYIRDKKDVSGNPVFTVRVKPATEGGAPNGKSVFLPEERLNVLRTNPQMFRSQQLLDPTPKGTEKLNFEHVRLIRPEEIPKKLYKFMAIDPAGSVKSKDSWAIVVVGVEPFRDDLGLSNIYITSLCAEPFDLDDALRRIVEMYCSGGRILVLGVEKVGAMTMEVHIANALRAKGKFLSVETGNLAILKPLARTKEFRIENNLVWPLNNGKIFLSSAVPSVYRDRMQMEMEKFPFWKDDILDVLSYVYDMVKDYRFPARYVEKEKVRDVWEGVFKGNRRESSNWLVM